MPPGDQSGTDPLVKELQAKVDDDLRTVTIYGEKSYEMLYIRENIEAIYSTVDLDVICDEIRMEGWGRQRLEDLFDAGRLNCNIYGFDEVMMLHFVKNGFEGVFVTYDRDTAVNVEDMISACKTHL